MGLISLTIVAFAASAMQPATPARLRAGSISNADYPAAANGAAGTTRISLVIDTNGRVGHCAVTQSSGNPILDSATCPLVVRRYRFTPATRNGQAVTGSYQQSVRWIPPS